MKVSSIMTEKVLKVRMDDSLETIRDILENVSFHHLLVVHDNKLVGIISDRDILRFLHQFLQADFIDRDTRTLLENKKAHQIMTHHPITVDKETNVETAVKIMLRNNISCLPVVSADGRIEGILTWRDILKGYIPT